MHACNARSGLRCSLEKKKKNDVETGRATYIYPGHEQAVLSEKEDLVHGSFLRVVEMLEGGEFIHGVEDA